MNQLWLVAVALGVVAACKQPTDKASETGSGSAGKNGTASAALEWQPATVAHDRVTVTVPNGWKRTDLTHDVFRPPPTPGLATWSEMSIDERCDGQCAKLPASEWAKRFDGGQIHHRTVPGSLDKVIQDTLLGETGRAVEFETRDTGDKPVRIVVVGHWQTNGEVYVLCRATLLRELAAKSSEFLQACKALEVRSFEQGSGGLP